MTQTQMNIRIDEHLKLKGDSAFEAIGWSPSQAARALWSFAARSIGDLHVLKEECAKLAGSEQATDKTESTIVRDGWTIVENGLVEIGVHNISVPQTESDDELRDRAMLDRLYERGLL